MTLLPQTGSNFSYGPGPDIRAGVLASPCAFVTRTIPKTIKKYWIWNGQFDRICLRALSLAKLSKPVSCVSQSHAFGCSGFLELINREVFSCPDTSSVPRRCSRCDYIGRIVPRLQKPADLLYCVRLIVVLGARAVRTSGYLAILVSKTCVSQRATVREDTTSIPSSHNSAAVTVGFQVNQGRP